VSTRTRTFEAARRECGRRGGDLLTIEDEAEYDFVVAELLNGIEGEDDGDWFIGECEGGGGGGDRQRMEGGGGWVGEVV
jgi:hypothetical protein